MAWSTDNAMQGQTQKDTAQGRPASQAEDREKVSRVIVDVQSDDTGVASVLLTSPTTGTQVRIRMTPDGRALAFMNVKGQQWQTELTGAENA